MSEKLKPTDRYDEVVSDLVDTVQAAEAERDALRKELARKDALINELTRVQAEVCPVCSATDWQYNPMRDRKTCGRCNTSFDFVDGVPVYDSIAAAPVWEWRRIWIEHILDERMTALKNVDDAQEMLVNAQRNNESLLLIIQEMESRLAAKDEEINVLNDYAMINGQLYDHAEMCIRKFMSFTKVTEEDGDNHQRLLDSRDAIRARLAELRSKKAPT